MVLHELSNMSTAYVVHIPSTLSLTSTRKNRNQKFQEHFSSVNFILMGLLQMLFFMAATLLCTVRDAQYKTSESP